MPKVFFPGFFLSAFKIGLRKCGQGACSLYCSACYSRRMYYKLEVFLNFWFDNTSITRSVSLRDFGSSTY